MSPEQKANRHASKKKEVSRDLEGSNLTLYRTVRLMNEFASNRLDLGNPPPLRITLLPHRARSDRPSGGETQLLGRDDSTAWRFICPRSPGETKKS